MLDFFRRYQWYFFLVITVVVVISFSFFGTYNTLSTNSWGEQVAFRAVNGKDVTRIEVDDLVNFLSTDSEDKLYYGGAWGLNFLNDGVIRKDFLQTGLAQELVSAYRSDLQTDLQKRLVKEQKYKPYTHPQARFIGVENVWTYFMPEMTSYWGTLKAAQNATDAGAFDARVKLYLAEKQIPSSTLHQVLRYQEKQYNWITPDPNLDRTDLALFGYHGVEDWFGPQFTRLLSQFIINASILAEQKGYDVSRAEVLADLVRNTEKSFKQNSSNIGVATSEEYFNEQLRRLGMDQTRAIRTWRQVMLFRRYFHDVGNSALVDTLTYQKFNDFAKQNANVDLYRLPAEFRLHDYTALQNLEIYLSAISKRSHPLDLPTSVLATSEVAKAYPELVQKRYLLETAHVNKRNLQSRVGIKEMWNWEVQDQNWAALKKQFPELSIKKDQEPQERFAALENLDAPTQKKVNEFAKAAIVDAHPEWLEQALASAQAHVQVVGLRPQGGKIPFEGVDTKEKRLELIRLLDSQEATPKLDAYTADHQNYYRIKVLEREAEPEILTFAEAKADGTLDELRDRILEKHYLSIRTKNPTAYQNEDKSWKNLAAVRDQVADLYFEKTIKALQKTSEQTKDQLAALRLHSYVQEIKAKLEKDPSQVNQFVRAQIEPSDQLAPRRPLVEQWRLEKADTLVERGAGDSAADIVEVLALPENAWSNVKTAPNGDLSFYQVKAKGASEKMSQIVAEQAAKAHDLLSADAQRVLMKHVLKQIADKGAISLAYLTAPNEDVGVPIAPDSIIP
jgi:GcvH upstream region-like protein